VEFADMPYKIYKEIYKANLSYFVTTKMVVPAIPGHYEHSEYNLEPTGHFDHL
jgi:hypothetical protein